jgi:hypothetical protein
VTRVLPNDLWLKVDGTLMPYQSFFENGSTLQKQQKFQTCSLTHSEYQPKMRPFFNHTHAAVVRRRTKLAQVLQPETKFKKLAATKSRKKLLTFLLPALLAL